LTLARKMSQRSPSAVRMRKARTKLLELLERLTRERKARWLRSRENMGTDYCRIGSEIIAFTPSNGTAEPIDVEGEVGGIVCDFRNWSLLWLTPLEEGQRMLALLRKSKIDDAQFRRWRANAYRSGLTALEDALRKKG
jgi:hypothetical protein